MLHGEINELLRMVIDQLEKDGYKRRDMCNLTLGNQCGPMFSEFMKGKDLGVKPLSRIIDAFGYDLHLVPIPKKSNVETASLVDTTTRDFIENCKIAMIGNLDNADAVSKAKNKVSAVFEEIGQDLLKEALGE
jgi:hypothetical protein